MSYKHNLIALGIAMSAAALAVSGCEKDVQQTEARAPQSYPTMKVQKANMTFNIEYTASIKGISDVDIYPQVSGTIKEILMQEGMPVKKDQVLFTIDPISYEAAYEKAKANVASAEANLATAKLTRDSRDQLYSKKAVSYYDMMSSHNTYDSALATLSEAKALLKAAENDLNTTEIKSPVDGVLGMTSIREGALVSSNMTTPLVSVSDNSSVYTYFSLSENLLLYIAKLSSDGSYGDILSKSPKIKFRLSDGEIYDQDGTIDAISGIVDATTGAVTVRATFPNPKRIMHSGGSGTVLIPVTVDDELVIPQTATFELQNKTFVYKVVDHKTVATVIEIMEVNDGKNYVVTSGLEEGDTIVTDGAGLLTDGVEIAEK